MQQRAVSQQSKQNQIYANLNIKNLQIFTGLNRLLEDCKTSVASNQRIPDQVVHRLQQNLDQYRSDTREILRAELDEPLKRTISEMARVVETLVQEGINLPRELFRKMNTEFDRQARTFDKRERALDEREKALDQREKEIPSAQKIHDNTLQAQGDLQELIRTANLSLRELNDRLRGNT